MTTEEAIACVRRYHGCGHPAIHAALVLAKEVEERRDTSGFAAMLDDYRECLAILNGYVVGGGTLAIRLQTALNGLKARMHTMASNLDAQRERQRNWEIREEVESFIRTVYSDGDGTIDPRDIPQILKSISDEFADARDQRSDLRGAVVDLTLLARRISRAKEPERRADLMMHVMRIADKVGCQTAVILRSDVVECKTCRACGDDPCTCMGIGGL